MDTQLSYNRHLVTTIKSQATDFAINEAFLESAPQFILQMTIILRTGNLCKLLRRRTLVYCLIFREFEFAELAKHGLNGWN
jgi:hypothetical protein